MVSAGSFWPLVVAAVLVVLVLLLRWTFSRGHSLIATPPRPGHVDDYGLLVPVADPSTFIEAEMIASRLRDAGLRATLAPTVQGPRVMVFAPDQARALSVLGARPDDPPSSTSVS